MHEVGCLFTLLSSGNRRWKCTGGARVGEDGIARGGVGRESTERGEGNGQHGGRFGVSNIFFTKCSFVMESKHFFWMRYSSPPARAGPVNRQRGRTPVARRALELGFPHLWFAAMWQEREARLEMRKSVSGLETLSTLPTLNPGQCAGGDCLLFPFKPGMPWNVRR